MPKINTARRLDESIEPIESEALQARLQEEINLRIEAEQRLNERQTALERSNKALEKIARSLDEQRQQLDMTLNHVLVGTFLINRHGQIVRANQTAMKMFGFDGDSILETCFCDLFEDPASAKAAQADFAIDHQETASEQGQNSPLHESVMRRLDGQCFDAEYAVNPVTGLDGRRQTVWIVRDITKRKIREAQRLALEQELSKAQKFEALGTLASGVAHEINTPLQYVGDNLQFLQNAMQSIAELLELGRAGESPEIFAQAFENHKGEFLLQEIPAAIEQSGKGIEDVVRIVRAIRDYSHPGSSDDMEPIDIRDVIRDAVMITSHEWKSRAKMQLELAEDPLMIEAVPGELDQVLVNMIVNAVQAMHRDDEDAELDKAEDFIRIEAKREGKHIFVRVCDTGCGVPDSVKARIFDPFFTTKGVGIGSGQGLAISQRIVCDTLGGEIFLQDTELGRGSCFCLRLLARPHTV